jgi:methylglutaconyl-CoA hydratase
MHSNGDTVARERNEVRIELAGDVLSFTLANATNGNEITGAMFEAMLAALRAQALAPSARVLRIRAEGAAFCLGRERGGASAEAIRGEVARLIELKRAIRESPLISVAEVQGDALGFGFGLAIVCDFTIVAEPARLGFPEMLFGLPPMAIMAYLGEYALPKHAFPLVLLGEPVSAERALTVGLVNDVVRAAALRARVDALIAKLLALDPQAARHCKEFFRATLHGSFETNARLALDGLTVASLGLRSRPKEGS